MDMILSENPDNPFSLKLPLNELYSNQLTDQFFSVLLNSIGGKDFLILVIGEAQSGKTTFLSKLTSEIQTNIKPCQLKIRESDDPASGNNHYPAFLYRTDQNQVIILDDAHDLNSQELSIILKNAWDTSKETNQVILFCEPVINTLISSLLRNMPKKTSVNKLYLPSFDETQTNSYINHYLEVTDRSEAISFSDKNIKNIFEKSKGLPGKINREAHDIYEDTVKSSPKKLKTPSKLNPVITGAIVLFVVFLIGGYIVIKNTSLIPIFSSNTVVSKTPDPTIITKKIQIEPDNDNSIKSDQIPKPDMTDTEKRDERQIPQTAEKKSIITETDIIETKEPQPIIQPQKQIIKPKKAIAKKAIEKPIRIQKTKPEPVKKEISSSSLLQEEWISKQPPQDYTVQILAAKENDAASRFKRLKIETDNEIAYYKMVSNGGIWYKFIYGNFQTLEQARLAIENLPVKLRDLGPWPRQFDSIQKDIVKFNLVHKKE
jgi:septal ring-binding cell division protein DamX